MAMVLNIKNVMKVLLTNWINVLGIFIVALIYATILNYNDENVSRTLLQSTIAALILVCLYGIMFWGILIASLVILDLLLIRTDRGNLKMKLLIEWLIISSPFVYWMLKYDEWMFLAVVLAFLITQLLREKLLLNRSK
jgi:hypothetical protein